MIAQTEAYLTWALKHGVELPRIPRRRVDAGGFKRLTQLPGARKLLDRWWWRTLDAMEADERR